jgi:hypothetical protein
MGCFIPRDSVHSLTIETWPLDATIYSKPPKRATTRLQGKSKISPYNSARQGIGNGGGYQFCFDPFILQVTFANTNIGAKDTHCGLVLKGSR